MQRVLASVPLQAWLPSIAQLSKLPLREVFLDVQWLLGSQAAFLAPFQQLGPTLRQLTLACRYPALPPPAPVPQTCPLPLGQYKSGALDNNANMVGHGCHSSLNEV